MKDLHRLTLAAAAELVRNRTLSPVDLTAACLERIAALNPTVNAFITVLADEAHAAALERKKKSERAITAASCTAYPLPSKTCMTPQVFVPLPRLSTFKTAFP